MTVAGPEVALAVAALSAALATALLLPSRLGSPRASPSRRNAPRWPAAAGAGVTVLALHDPTAAALAAVGAGAALSTSRLVSRRRRRRRSLERADLVVEQVEALVSELRAGRPAVLALRHCVVQWPGLAPVGRAAELGGGVPQAWHDLAREPGAAALAHVAAAWQVSEGTGAAMAETLGKVAQATRDGRAVDRLVETELATAAATARLVAALPLVVLVAATGLGGDPWRFLLGTPPGLVCLGAGVLLAHLGLSWVDRIAAGARET